jgi:hypothetical protein
MGIKLSMQQEYNEDIGLVGLQVFMHGRHTIPTSCAIAACAAAMIQAFLEQAAVAWCRTYIHSEGACQLEKHSSSSSSSSSP